MSNDTGDHNGPLISVIVIDSRSEDHPDWVNKCINSINDQSYKPHQIILVKNTDKKKTIGECWNTAIDKATGEWVLFVGDDDYLSPDYLYTLATYIQRFEKNNQTIDAISTYMTTFDEDKEGMAIIQRPPTGLWRLSYFDKQRFNENLTVGVDREFLEEARKNNVVYVVVSHHYGYFYRQHSGGTCTRIRIDPDPRAIYMIAKYPAFVSGIRDRLRDEGYDVHLLNEFNGKLAEKAEVIFCEWADSNAIQVSHFNTDAIKILRVHAYEVFSSMIHHIDFDAFDHILVGSQHILDHLEMRLKRVLKNARVQNLGVDTEKFTITDTPKNPKAVAWVGNLDQKKGAQLLLMIAEHFPGYEFHCLSKEVQPDIKRLFDYHNPQNITIHPYVDDIAEFYQDKSYILNTSPREGNPVSVLEGMACGLKPIIYNWDGAENIHEGYTFNNMKEVNVLLSSGKSPLSYREKILVHYNFETMYEVIKKLMNL